MPDSLPPSPGGERTPAAPALVLAGARLPDGRTVDVRISDGRIEAVGTAGSLVRLSRAGDRPGDDGPDVTRVDLGGYLLLPAPAEPHAHPDTALTAGGPAAYGAAEVCRRTTEAALLQLGYGATALRAQVRVGGVYGLHSLEGVLRARDSLTGFTGLTAVAVPRVLTGTAGADSLAALVDAVKMGAEVVGGCPDLDPDPAGYVEAVLGVAAEHGCAVDLHTHGDDPARLTRLAAMAGGLRPGVTIGPCAGLSLLPPPDARRVADRLAAAGISVVVLPQGDCAAMERDGAGRALPPAPVSAPVRLLRSAGVRVAAGSGALRDAANPVGRGDPLEAAFLLATLGGESPEDAYAAVSGRARGVMGLRPVRLEAGFPAELLAVRAESVAGALAPAYSRVVVHRGRVVARTSAVREYCASGAAGAAGSAGPESPAGPAVPLELPRQGRQAPEPDGP
ncbi:amidohydrolase family protein [Streptomyces zingiberis]|uniref:Amidohydrolase family protein n=1 Tax=Streptomyces zingiberis TaxID=2053010 RepID=A0ABX1C4V9_9ACTN|nr:amidohydrolase family protein [Streptomyces zingiberis]NJQ02967.1 amidohydrolase family protein [Streptomyces zingiberis]